MTTTGAVRAVGVSRPYRAGVSVVTALDSVSVALERGRFTSVVGPSGSGKSTLLHCLAGLDTVDSGAVYLGDTELGRLSDRELTRVRRDRLGFVFQAFNLLPSLTAAENIALPARLAGRQVDRDWTRRVVDALGLADRLGHRPSQLSGGEQQRVAVARALVGRPEVVLGDEPTGNLNSHAADPLPAVLHQALDRIHSQSAH